MTGGISEIGLGIMHYAGDEPAEIKKLITFGRFLNVLWLPCPLSELTVEQIILTNRYRERTFNIDAQFSHAENIRKVFEKILKLTNPNSVVELGCGKRPLRLKNNILYTGVDIDDEAVMFCLDSGLSAIRYLDLLEGRGNLYNIDIVFGIFMFHFHVNSEIWKILYNALGEEGFMVFNGIVDDGYHFIKKLSEISECGFSIQVIKNSKLSIREFIFLIYKSNNNERYASLIDEALR